MNATEQDFNDVRALLTYAAICGFSFLLAVLIVSFLRF